jgi:hypothetical protein
MDMVDSTIAAEDPEEGEFGARLFALMLPR